MAGRSGDAGSARPARGRRARALRISRTRPRRCSTSPRTRRSAVDDPGTGRAACACTGPATTTRARSSRSSAWLEALRERRRDRDPPVLRARGRRAGAAVWHDGSRAAPRRALRVGRRRGADRGGRAPRSAPRRGHGAHARATRGSGRARRFTRFAWDYATTLGPTGTGAAGRTAWGWARRARAARQAR